MEEKKECQKCKDVKTLDNFAFRNKEKSIYHKFCKDCACKYAKEYRMQNKDKVKTGLQLWYMKKGKLWKKNYENENRSSINSKNRERYRKDLQYHAKKLLRSRFKGIMKGKLKTKPNTILTFLGITLEIFVKWIESQFTIEMDWENQGNYWEIDHVKPCCSYDLLNEEEVKKCFHWSNMRPLSKIKNCSKNGIVDNDVISKHNNIVEKFKKTNL